MRHLKNQHQLAKCVEGTLPVFEQTTLTLSDNITGATKIT